MEMRINKKAQAFTIIAVFIIGIIAISYSLENVVDKKQGIRDRVETANSFVFSMREDLKRQLYTAGYRAIFIAEDNISRTGNYIGNFENFFMGAVVNGTGTKNASDIMQGAKISDIRQNLQDSAEKMNMNINISNVSIGVKQKTPWKIGIIMNFSYFIEDRSELASWQGEDSVSSNIDITNFEDPLYSVETKGKLPRKIKKTPYDGDYVSGSDVSNLETHIDDKYYAANNNSPDFIGRFEGDFSPNKKGIESFVIIPEISSQELDVREKSCIDYIYFSSNNPSYYQISGLSSWVKIDENHLEKYQVENLTQ